MEIGEDDPVKMRETRRRKKIVRRCIMVMMRMDGGIGSIVILTAVNREYEIEKKSYLKFLSFLLYVVKFRINQNWKRPFCDLWSKYVDCQRLITLITLGGVVKLV